MTAPYDTVEDSAQSLCMLQSASKWVYIRKTRQSKAPAPPHRRIPPTSEARQTSSLSDTPLDLTDFICSAAEDAKKNETVLYLGYGSNMAAETFLGRRNIKPISQINVVVPSLTLTFDLPGIPYTEPCFANVRYRDISPTQPTAIEKPKPTPDSPYHKDRWRKGLVGVVYEVTCADYAHIIATEGGGASYKDVVVDCHALSSDPTDPVPALPKNLAFKAHTLFSPPQVVRPETSYAQPSARYLKLITDGAIEHSLPNEYHDFLNGIRAYTLTKSRQRLGQFIFLVIWAPIFAFFFGGAQIFVDKNGRYPEWFAKLAMAIFEACWGSYDDIFKGIFGDGERTIGKGDEEEPVEIRLPEDEKGLLVDSEEGGRVGYGTLRDAPPQM